MFRFFFNNSMRQATRSLAIGSLFTGLFLIGFGLLVFVLRDVFAFIAAALFFFAGFSSIIYAVKIYFASRQMHSRSDSDAYRENVRIHIEENHFE